MNDKTPTRRFRKKPVVIEAVQYPCVHPAVERFLDTAEGIESWSATMAKAWGKHATEFAGIRTLEGIMRVSDGDWIITGVQGEHYPCKPDIFAATYEDADAPKPEAQAAAVYYSGSPASVEAAARVLLAAGWRLEANGWQQSVGTSDQDRFNTWAKSAGLITESSGLVFVNSHCDTAWLAWQAALSTPASHDAQKPAREEMSPDFTDSARAAIAWVLYHHQGGSSPVGQPLRFALGMGAHEPLPDWRIAEAKAWAEWASATTADFHAQQPAVVGDGVRPFAWYRPRGDQEPEFRTSPPPEGHGWLPVPGFTTSEKLDAALTPAATPVQGCAERVHDGNWDSDDYAIDHCNAQKEGNGNG